MRLSYRSNTNEENRSPLEVTEAQILGRTGNNSSRAGYPRHIPVPQSSLKAYERVVGFSSVPVEKQELVSVGEQTLPECLNNQKVMDVTDKPVQLYSYCKWEPSPRNITSKLNYSLTRGTELKSIVCRI